MYFDKNKSISKDDNVKIYIDKIDTNERIMIDEEYIFLDNIKTTKEIVVTKKTIVLGDIECNFLNVLAELICYGNMKADSVFTTVDIQCYKGVLYDNLISGNIKKANNSDGNVVTKEVEKIIEVVKEVPIEKEVTVEVNPLENIEINMENIDYPLTIIDEFKDKIVEYADGELIFLDEDIFIDELEKIGLTFAEFKNYSDFLKKIKKFSKLDTIVSLKQYLDFLLIIKDTPNWLEEIDLVENTVSRLMIHSFEDLKSLESDLKNKNEVLNLIGDIVYCKKELYGNYDDLIDFIIDKYKHLLITQYNTDDYGNYERENLLQHNKDIRDLYEEYIWKKGSLIECEVKSINDGYLDLCQIGIENNQRFLITMNTKESNKYAIGQKIFGCISKVNITEEKLYIEITNDSDNMSRLLFNYLCPNYGLSDCMIQNFSRIKGKSTCIVIVLSTPIQNNDKLKVECRNIESQMKKYLDGEEVNIFIYDKDVKKFAANILDIDPLDIKINKESGRCEANIYIYDEQRINNLLEVQRENLSKVFAYPIDIKIKNIKLINKWNRQNKLKI